MRNLELQERKQQADGKIASALVEPGVCSGLSFGVGV